MDIILFLAVGLFFIVSLCLPWFLRGRIQLLEEEITVLKQQLGNIISPSQPLSSPLTQSDLQSPSAAKPFNSEKADLEPVWTETPQVAVAKPITLEKISFEQQFGARLPVWIGGISLALAGFFLVKYSIDAGLLNPLVRIILGLCFGIGLIYSANRIRLQTNFANGTRISQSLAGAGIADLYVCLYAATNLYHLIPNMLGFLGLAIVTAAAVILSLRHGRPIALLGLLGGFITPALYSTKNPQAFILFTYLYFIIAGLLFVIRKENWWPIAPLTIIGAFIWVLVWVFNGYLSPRDSLCLSLFLLALSGTVIAFSHPQYQEDITQHQNRFSITSLLNYLTLGGAILLTGIIVTQAGLGLFEWGLCGLLALSSIMLAYFKPALYGFAPWLSMIVNAVMLMGWTAMPFYDYALIISIFSIIYSGSGYLLQYRSEKPYHWALLCASTCLIYYLIAYFMLKDTGIVAVIPHFWTILALLLASLGFIELRNIMKNVPSGHPYQQYLLAIYAAASTAFVAIALSIEITYQFLPLAFAVEVAALSLINNLVNIKALRSITAATAIIFGCLFMPQLVHAFELLLYNLLDILPASHHLTLSTDYIYQLGMPALFFLLSSYLLRRQKDDLFAQVLECTAIGLLLLTGYYLVRQIFGLDNNGLLQRVGFFERGVITNLFFAISIACLTLGIKFNRKAVWYSGLVIAAAAFFRICCFDIIIYNPLWSMQAVGATPLYNALILTYGAPIVWIWIIIQELPQTEAMIKWRTYGYAFLALLAFLYISYNVRQFFHGTYLYGVHKVSYAEIYSYSIAWLFYGVGLLLIGTWRQDKTLRQASLVVILLTVAKVFLYDASELQGLLRVLSFLGLGLSLLALSWFYTRFVFGKSPNVSRA